MKKPVPNRTQRQQLLTQLSLLRFRKEAAQEYGLPDLVEESAIEEKQIELEIKLLALKR